MQRSLVIAVITIALLVEAFLALQPTSPEQELAPKPLPAPHTSDSPLHQSIVNPPRH